MDKAKLLELYEKAFNNDGTVKVCGRETTKKLIRACQEESTDSPYDGQDFGSEKTGYMNVDNVRSFCQFIRQVHTFSENK